MGNERGRFILPNQIAMDRDRNIYVADSGNNRIQKINMDGNVLDIGSVPVLEYWENPSDKLICPVGVAIGKNNDIYVTNYEKIWHFNSNGEYIGKIQNYPDEGAFYGRLETDIDGNVYTVDWKNHRIVIFNKDLGNPRIIDGVEKFGRFKSPAGISIDKSQDENGNWISNGIVTVFDVDKIYFFSLGITIKSFFINTDTIWVNPNNNTNYPYNIDINYEITNPGGNVLIQDINIITNKIEKIILNEYQEPKNYSVKWDGKDSKGDTYQAKCV